jgi:hypothetical protein
MPRFERRLRLATGLVLAAYLLGHFANHALGIASLGAMDAMRAALAAWWRSAPGTFLLYGALLAHAALALAGFSAPCAPARQDTGHRGVRGGRSSAAAR